MTAKKPLRILCFGDSLTSGFFSYGLGSHPYAGRMRDVLAEAFPDLEIRVEDNGMPGDIVSGAGFKKRLENAFLNQLKRYDWTIILGGTNDLGIGVPDNAVFESLKASWDVPLRKGSRVLALTVPECAVKMESLDKRRNSLNKNILSYQQRNFYAHDLHADIPYHSLSTEDQEMYWDDGLHLTEEGYDWMGGHIAKALIRLMKSEEGTPLVRRSHGVAGKNWDDGNFDEENGNPKELSQGYVVVRKKDLD